MDAINFISSILFSVLFYSLRKMVGVKNCLTLLSQDCFRYPFVFPLYKAIIVKINLSHFLYGLKRSPKNAITKGVERESMIFVISMIVNFFLLLLIILIVNGLIVRFQIGSVYKIFNIDLSLRLVEFIRLSC